jgi:hypothetical protein
MTWIRNIALAVATAVFTAAAATACGQGLAVLSLGPRNPTPCPVALAALPSVLGVIADRDSAFARAQLKTMLVTARPNEQVMLWDADTGRRIGSFTTPPGVTMPGPTPPAGLPSDPTLIQTATFNRELARYDAALRADVFKLHRRWLSRLLTWASHILAKSKAAESPGQQVSETGGLNRALRNASADFASLQRLPGIRLGPRMVLVLLRLDGVPMKAPPHLPTGVRGATVVVTGFPGTSQQETIWRTGWIQAGARAAVLLTPLTSQELPSALEPVLNMDSQSATVERSDRCSRNH